MVAYGVLSSRQESKCSRERNTARVRASGAEGQREGVGQREDVSRNSACKGDDGQRGGRRREGGGSRWRRDVLLVEQSNTETASRGETPSTALSSRVHRTVATNSSAFLRAPRERVCTVETYQARGETRRQGKRFREMGDRGVRVEIERSALLHFPESSRIVSCFVHTDFFLLFSSVRRVFFTRHAKVAEFVILRITTSLFRETST